MPARGRTDPHAPANGGANDLYRTASAKPAGIDPHSVREYRFRRYGQNIKKPRPTVFSVGRDTFIYEADGVPVCPDGAALL